MESSGESVEKGEDWQVPDVPPTSRLHLQSPQQAVDQCLTRLSLSSGSTIQIAHRFRITSDQHMEQRTLGTTGLQVSRLGLGVAKHGDDYRDDADVEMWLHHALDAGVNFIDTAAMYNRSEERIGRFLASRREEFFLATKCGVHRAGGEAGAEIVEDYSRDGILRVVEESRSRLRMDVIDLVQFHGSPPVELVDEAFTALLELKARGRTCPGNDPGRVRHALYSFAC